MIVTNWKACSTFAPEVITSGGHHVSSDRHTDIDEVSSPRLKLQDWSGSAHQVESTNKGILSQT